MDFSLNTLKDKISSLTVADVKYGVRAVQNAVMNYTEMEAKVREATNNDPWGAPGKLLSEIAAGTHSNQLISEIMPLVYSRFTEKSTDQWRQIYKALQLLDYLIKNGSERVVDDARDHVSLLRMLRKFHHIDQNGRDQGSNIRHRSEEIVKLLNDVEKIRTARKKEKDIRRRLATAGGSVSSDSYRSSSAGGFGNTHGRVYGDGGGFGGEDRDYSTSRGANGDTFEEYDEFENGETPQPPTAPKPTTTTTVKRATPAKQEAVALPAPDIDLFYLSDEPVPSTKPSASSSSGFATSIPPPSTFGNQSVIDNGDDDFDDFQSAPSTHTTATTTLNTFAPPPLISSLLTPNSTPDFKPRIGLPSQSTTKSDPFSGLGTGTSSLLTPASPSSPASFTQLKPSPVTAPYQAAQPNYFVAPIRASDASTPGPSSIFSSKSATTSSAFSSSPGAFGSNKGNTITTASNLGKPMPSSAPVSKAPKTGGGGDAFAGLLGLAKSSSSSSSSSTPTGSRPAGTPMSLSTMSLSSMTPSSVPLQSMHALAGTAPQQKMAALPAFGGAAGSLGYASSADSTYALGSAAPQKSKTAVSSSLGNGLDDLLL